MSKSTAIAICLIISAVTPALSQSGPVATQCAKDIETYCAGKGHGSGQTRACLQANRDKVSAECRQALDTTGPGSGRGRMK
ncbi:cysteine rich repeat-containing protein [Bradyrhizobium sp.]|uniref:cysteine rich repeat-containing protein n=1 Tax=Bradyrhizobium sp. TaxID=376 RepID=UPI0023A71074|nr:cysteine rich repeat-containing protein [Bradyrhizobium sp.]MDE1935721.1 hypothetical protein [Bradyrhizobium sp.]MDE2063438.1 hypothetical protein [Bradyrhizobium sp.]